jgi:IMP dehydrogenase
MQFLHKNDSELELTYNDVFLVPQRSGINSRFDVSLAPLGVPGLQIPLIVANMTAAAGKRMAETVARRGGLVVLPQDYSLDRIAEIVNYLKSAHPLYETPVTLESSESIQTALNLINKRAHGAVIIVDSSHRPIGLFTAKDAEGFDRHSSLSSVMRRDIVCWKDSDGQDPEVIFNFLVKNRIKLAPVIDADGKLIGIITKKGCLRSTIYSPALNEKGELLTAVAVGARNAEMVIPKLIQLGVDVIVLDTAHGHQDQMLDAVRKAREIMGPDRPLVAGNVVTATAVEDLVAAGANIIKVGVGPGAMCITRMMTGVGRPQFSAVYETAKRAKELGAFVWADGGIRSPRDVALAIAAGADSVMFASWFAGTYESPADILFDEKGEPYKSHHGMASTRAVHARSANLDEFTIARRAYFEEGISSSRMYLKKDYEGVEDIIDQICAGIRSSFTYTGASDISKFQEQAIIGVQTTSGYAEGKALPTSW